MFKVCKKCGESKLLEDFPMCKGALRARCKKCHTQDAAEYAKKNRERVLERMKKWHRENKKPVFMGPPIPKHIHAERRKAKRLAMTERQRALEIASKKKWAEKNKHVSMEIVRRRQARKKLATPKWADRKAMQEVYRQALELSKTTGVAYDVDHIVPLTNEVVCGLHCEFNLRVLPRRENRKKANKWDESLLQSTR